MSAGIGERRATRDRRRGQWWAFVSGNCLATLAAVAVAAAAFWPVYRTDRFIVVAAVACGLGLAIALAGARFRWPAWVMIIVTVLAYLLAGVPLAIPGLAVAGVLPSPAGLRELLAATALSWKQLVTIVLPVGSYQALLVPAFILTLLCTVVAASIALRARHPELALLAPAVMFTTAIALGPSVASAPTQLGLALFLVLLFWLLWLRWYRRRFTLELVARRSRGSVESMGERRLAAARGMAGAAVIIAVAIGAGGVAAIALPAHAPRNVVRVHVQQPFDPRAYPSPLSAFRSYLQQGKADEPMLTVAGLPAGARIRLAALDTYDGVVYSVGTDDVSSASGSFTRLPYRLDQDTVDGAQATLTVTVDGYDGIWVPGAGALERIDFSGPSAAARTDAFFYNDTSRTGVVLGGLARGDRYRAESVVPAPVHDLGALRPGTAALPPLGVVPEGITQALSRYVQADAAPGRRLQSMIEGLQADGYVSHGVDARGPASRSGHGADRITQLFTEQPMIGDAEQYAVAAALMARQIGFPARVVVGFVPGQRAGTTTVTGADISAWIEVQGADGGWVTVDPNPPVRAVPPKAPDQATVISRPRSVVPPPVAEPAPHQEAAPSERTQDDPPTQPDPWIALLASVLRVAGWSLLALAVLAAPFGAVALSKLRRRRLRARAPTPLAQIQGGWHEVADTVLDYGIEVPRGATRTELAEAVGGMRPLVLASVVDRAAFSPSPPTPADATAVWRAVRELRRTLGAERTRRERLRALLSLRSLGRYAGTAPKRKGVS